MRFKPEQAGTYGTKTCIHQVIRKECELLNTERQPLKLCLSCSIWRGVSTVLSIQFHAIQISYTVFFRGQEQESTRNTARECVVTKDPIYMGKGFVFYAYVAGHMDP